jgi:hypothetical protein
VKLLTTNSTPNAISSNAPTMFVFVELSSLVPAFAGTVASRGAQLFRTSTRSLPRLGHDRIDLRLPSAGRDAGAAGPFGPR